MSPRWPRDSEAPSTLLFIMKSFPFFLLTVLLLTACPNWQGDVASTAVQSSGQEGGQKARAPIYETRANHDPDGIGKFYMGREIAHVMGHEGAAWLERPDREETELPNEVVKQMNLKPT